MRCYLCDKGTSLISRNIPICEVCMKTWGIQLDVDDSRRITPLMIPAFDLDDDPSTLDLDIELDL